MLRAFIAFELPESARAALKAAIDPLRARVPPSAAPSALPPLEAEHGVRKHHRPARPASGAPRWIAPENWHITLKFLGSIPEKQALEIGAQLASLGSLFPPIATQWIGLDAFPSARKARVIVGRIQASAPLAAVWQTTQMLAEDHGFIADTRAFKPHATVGRCRPARDVQKLISRAEVSATNFQLSRVVLLRSELSPAGSRYSELASVELAAKPT